MKVFVTGGTGFIGKPTVACLRRNGHELQILSRSAGKGDLQGDLSDPSAWMEALKDFKPDAVVHLAWEEFPRFDTVITAKNIAQTLNLYRFLVEIDCPKVVGMSSAIEYEGMNGKVSEDAPFPPAEAEEKHGLLREGRIFTARCMDRFSAEHRSVFVRALPFLVYGPGQRARSLLPSIIRQLSEGATIEVKNPSLAHDFVYVGDVAEALTLLVEKPIPSGRYNVGSGALTSVADMVNTALRLFGKDPLFDAPKELTGVYADIQKMESATGWHPKTSIEEGIRQMIP